MWLGIAPPLENVISCAENIRSVPKGQDFSCDKGHWVERARDGEEEWHSFLAWRRAWDYFILERTLGTWREELRAGNRISDLQANISVGIYLSMCLVEAKGRSRTASSVSLLHIWSYLINNLHNEAELKTFVKLCLWPTWRTKALDRYALGSKYMPSLGEVWFCPFYTT